MDRTEIAERILALPNREQQKTLQSFRRLATQSRAKRGPVPLTRFEMAHAVGINPDPWQAEVLATDAQRILLNCSRQSGKSTITALLAVHTAHEIPDSLVLLLSPALRQSGELFKKALDIHRGLGNRVTTAAESALRLELTNGSRIVSLPGKEHTVRGFSGVRLIAMMKPQESQTISTSL